MGNWTYVGSADFGSVSGVSLNGHIFDEFLAIATVNNFDIYQTTSTSQQQILNTPSLEFYWIPNLGEVQLTQSVKQPLSSGYANLLITVSFTPTNVRTYTVKSLNLINGSSNDLNTSANGHIDVYCR